MRIALVVTPCSDVNLRLAAQVGVTDIVGRYTGPGYDQLERLRVRVTAHSMTLSVVEGYLPIDRCVHGRADRDEQLDQFTRFLEHMRRAGVGIACYNWMPDADWTRTSVKEQERGGALVTGFDAALVADAPPERGEPIVAEALWENIAWFLERVVPAAEENGVTLALHPDDPPMTPLRGQDRIFTKIEDFERLVQLVPSERNAICFCQGCFSEMGYDVPEAIRRLGRHIRYAHFRNVRGCGPRFVETFHDNGQIDMAAAIRAFREIGYDGPMRPDHVPVLAGERPADDLLVPTVEHDRITTETYNPSDGPAPPGYTMLGRLHAIGYTQGLIEATARGEL